MAKSKLLLIFVIVALVAAFFALDLGQYLTLDYIKSQQQAFQNFYSSNKELAFGVFAAMYIAVTGLSLPGAAIMTLLAGALFGVVAGTIIVSFASTIGATIAFLIARYILKDMVQKKYGDKLKAINEGFKKEGAFYLFTLRLVPLFPFFLINILMGLLPIRTIVFFLVSQIGMLPGTIVYVFAGTELAKIQSVGDIASANIIIAFTILGIFPLIAKRLVDYIRTQKILKPFRRPKSFDYNLVVIGGGAAGLVSSYIAAAVKAKVAIIEKHKMGGDCLNTGCVPSKALLRTAKMLSYAKRAEEFGLKKNKVEFEFKDVMQRVKEVVTKIEPHDSIERYTKLGVDCITGKAKITDPYHVEISGRTISTKNIIIATGGAPLVPSIPGLQDVEYVTSDTIWNLKKQPKRLLVMGGGPIGSELAQAFARLGTNVTMVEMAPQILIREDEEVIQTVENRLEHDGITVLKNHKGKSFKNEGKRSYLICDNNDKEVRVPFDVVLIALGRRARIEGFGAEELNIELNENSTIKADPWMRTNYPNIYVCGDVTGPYQFTHVAAHQAWYASVNALFSPFKRFKIDYSVIPWATFTDPEVARVGLNEKEAKEKNIPYEATSYGIDDLDRAIADSEGHGFVKMLTKPGTDKILGVTIVGSHAGDIIAEFVLAMKHGIGLNKILGTIHIYPTLAESNKYVAGQWKQANKPEGLLNWVEKFHKFRRGEK